MITKVEMKLFIKREIYSEWLVGQFFYHKK